MSESKSNAHKMDYQCIYRLYELESKVKREGDVKIRMYLTRRLKKYLDLLGKPKNLLLFDLSKEEQDYFICHFIHTKTFLSYTDDYKKSRIERNLDQYAFNSLMKSKEYIDKRNEVVDKIKERFCEVTDSLDKKRKGYDSLCEVIKDYNVRFPVPDFETYAKNPLRAYDYIMDYKTANMDITPLLVQVLAKIVEEKLDVKLNRWKMFECIRNLGDMPEDYDYFEFDSFPIDYNKYEEIGMSKDEYEEMCNKIGKWHRYEEIVNKLDFYEYIRFKK